MNESLKYIEELKIKHSDNLGTIRRLNFIEKELKQYNEIETKTKLSLPLLWNEALENGVFYKYLPDKEIYKIKGEYISIGKKGLVVAYDDDFDDRILYIIPYEQYGKTWALTKEELE